MLHLVVLLFGLDYRMHQVLGFMVSELQSICGLKKKKKKKSCHLLHASVKQTMLTHTVLSFRQTDPDKKKSFFLSQVLVSSFFSSIGGAPGVTADQKKTVASSCQRLPSPKKKKKSDAQFPFSTKAEAFMSLQQHCSVDVMNLPEDSDSTPFIHGIICFSLSRQRMKKKIVVLNCLAGWFRFFGMEREVR